MNDKDSDIRGTTDCIEMLQVAILHVRRVNQLLAEICGIGTQGG